MASWEPVDIDRDDMEDEDYKWDDDIVKDLELRFNKLREFNETLNESTDEDTIEITEKAKNNKKRSHTQLDSRKQVIAFQDRVMTINIKEAQHPLK